MPKSEQTTPASDAIPSFGEFRSGYLAVIGLPNAGKSTLLNQFLQQKLSIVSRRPQTTRRNVIGILNEKEYQAIFVDTPGILSPRYNLQTYMMKQVKQAIEDADVLIYLVDATDPAEKPQAVAERLKSAGKPVVLGLNKVDAIDKAAALPMISAYRDAFDFHAIIPISALTGDGVMELLVPEVVSLLPFGPPYYPTDYISDLQERFFVAEIVREKIFEQFAKEVPYSTHVEIEQFKDRPKGKTYIQAIIYVERNSQKQIIIGSKGSALKRIGSTARHDIEIFLGRPVFLELFVKVTADWRRKEGQLKRLGYA